jgi:L-ascorbate metabolism protein UlaG (beta-lactamase superfamily)
VAVLCAACAACAACGNLATPSADLYPTPARNAITFWGHACVYIDVEGVGIVTDPVWATFFFPRWRRIAAPPPASYAQANVVLISHAHNDHLSESSLQTFPDDVVILCPSPCVQYLDHVGRTVRAMMPGDTYQAGDVRITAVAAYHPGSRWSLSAASDGRALGYVIEAPAATVFYSGDTEYFAGFSDVGWKYEPDIAILNVNGHLPSADVSRAAWALRAPVVIPTHWGGYRWWLRGGNKRPRDYETLARLLGERLLVLEVGESVPLVGPTIRRHRRRRTTGATKRNIAFRYSAGRL